MRQLFLYSLILLSTSFLFGSIRMPAFFSNHMVLQRDKPIKIYGFASYENEVTVQFDNQVLTATIEEDGFFEVEFPALTADGKSHKIVVKGSQTIEINDVLIGDVIIVGGQSNMEWPVSQSNDPAIEMANANFPNIRLFTVPKLIHTEAQYDLEAAGWTICSAENVKGFSAIGFFTARQLHADYKIPIGVIANAWGGTNIQGWCPSEAFEGLPLMKDSIRAFKANTLITRNNERLARQWLQNLDKNDVGIPEAWSQPEVDKSNWMQVSQPGLWEEKVDGWKKKDGIIYVARQFDVADPRGSALLALGAIDDEDMTYINGVLVGSMNQYNTIRRYSFDEGLLKKGKNEIVIRIKDTGGGGGLHSPADSLFLMVASKKINLAGNWRIAEGTVKLGPKPSGQEPNAYPTNRYNAMVSPLIGLGAKAYLYYQGESDTNQPKVYEDLLQRMIRTYRTNFNDQKLPFIIIQLANYLKQDEVPVMKSNWAELRAAQASALKLPYTGLVSTIDIGEAEDIHPRNKQSVAERAVKSLKRVAYGEKIIDEGPIVESATKTPEGYILQMGNISKDLIVKGNDAAINGFVIKTSDGKLQRVEGKKLSSTKILLPTTLTGTTLRYLWANNPGQVQIYNGDGLPMAPFEMELK